MSKLLASLTIFFIFLGCGFEPIYKISEDNFSSGNYTFQIINQVSREIIDEVDANNFSSENEDYKVLLPIREDLTPLIVNTNGTVAKYRIEIEIDYELIKLDSNEVVSEGTTRGFAQYDVVASEISNEDTKKSMKRIATKNAIQIMNSRIQSSIAK